MAFLNVEGESSLEYWHARDLMVLLGYSKWGNFVKVVENAGTRMAFINLDS